MKKQRLRFMVLVAALAVTLLLPGGLLAGGQLGPDLPGTSEHHGVRNIMGSGL